MVHTPNALGGKPWAVFEEWPNEKWFDFLEVREKIELLTDKHAGKNKGIIKEAIKMTIYSPDCPDLTIIDLPGITRIPLKNSDQPENIEEITKGICSEYCSDERTVILCVVPANQDMSTQDSLKMAMDIDRDGKRTIGVITKIDIMDAGTDVRGLLLGNDFPLALGYVGVKNRSQQDIKDKVPVAKALLKEDQYFSSSPVYQTIPREHLGTKALVEKLSTVLFKQ